MMKDKYFCKKGVSPIIATVLLIALVIVLASIIYIWSRSFVEEVVQKDGMPQTQVCENIALSAEAAGSNLNVLNRGKVSIYDLEIVIQSEDGTKTIKGKPIRVGGSEKISLGTTNYNTVEVYPVFLGVDQDGNYVPYTCKEGFLVEI